MKLDKRLMMVAKMVRPCDVVADIGTDHAYLPVFLIENSIIKRAYAGDVRVGPLNNAKKTIESMGLFDKIEPILSDGLKKIPHDCNDFVIAGMGGELIAKILGESKWVEEKDNHFVLQPQTHPEDLREYLLSNGYEILKEDVVKDGRHLYLALEVAFTGNKKPYTTKDLYIGELLNSSSEFKFEYLREVLRRLLKQYEKSDETKRLIEEIKEAIE